MENKGVWNWPLNRRGQPLEFVNFIVYARDPIVLMLKGITHLQSTYCFKSDTFLAVGEWHADLSPVEMAALLDVGERSRHSWSAMSKKEWWLMSSNFSCWEIDEDLIAQKRHLLLCHWQIWQAMSGPYHVLQSPTLAGVPMYLRFFQNPPQSCIFSNPLHRPKTLARRSEWPLSELVRLKVFWMLFLQLPNSEPDQVLR